VRTLVVSCPDWPVTATGRPPLEPTAVVAGQHVVAASPAARRAGVRPGQRRRQAQSCCPELVVLPRDLGQEARAFEPLVAALEAFGALVAVGEPGWMGIATRGPARYFGGEASLAEAVAAAVASVLPVPGAPLHVGVADGPFAATLAASRGAVVQPGGTAAFLAPFPIEALGVPELADVLRRLGITTLGRLAALDEAVVAARFGAAGARAHRLASGREEGPLAVAHPPRELAVGREFDPPLESLDALGFAARALAEGFCGRLAAAGLSCTLLELEVRVAGRRPVARRWASEGAWSAALVAERLRWQLEALATAPGAAQGEGRGGVAAVRLTPVELGPAQGRQLGLLGRPAACEEQVARVVARVQRLLGPEEVLRPVLVGGRGPGERARLVPAGDPLPSDAGLDAPWPGQVPPLSPAVVPLVPPAVELLDSRGEAVRVDGRGQLSAPPATLSAAGRHPAPVLAWAGPWPVDERWWDAAARRRRARLQVLLPGGEAHLLALEGGRWWVEGSYD